MHTHVQCVQHVCLSHTYTAFVPSVKHVHTLSFCKGDCVHALVVLVLWFCLQVLVTVPLAVLKANMVTFTPPLNSRKKAAIQNLGAGLVEKVPPSVHGTGS